MNRRILAVAESLEIELCQRGNDNYDLLMRDGGRVRFLNTNPGAPLLLEYVATAIIDPYGLTTELIRDAAGRLWRIKEPGGRFLQINYDSRSVQAFDGIGNGIGNLIETVTYIFQPLTIAGFTGSYLTRVQYDDGTAATYTYQPNNVWQAYYGLVKTCHDPRYAGVMKDIEYEYMGFVGAHQPAVGEVRKEKNAGTHQTVSEVIYPTSGPPAEWLRRTEKRGDGSMRLFQYDGWGQLASYTDFESHTSSIRYEDPGIGTDHYFKILTDARTHETRIKKELIAGAVLSVTRGSAQPVRYEYTDANNPYYLSAKTDENGKVTHYDRDGANRIWRIRYPDDGEETFTYNNFGQVLTHA